MIHLKANLKSRTFRKILKELDREKKCYTQLEKWQKLHEETLRTLEFKEWYYNTAKENGTTDVPKNMKLDELPEDFREVRLKLRGN